MTEEFARAARRNRAWRAAGSAILALALCACSSDGLSRPPALLGGLGEVDRAVDPQGVSNGRIVEPASDPADGPEGRAEAVYIPSIAPDAIELGLLAGRAGEAAPEPAAATVDAVVPPLPVPAFIDVVFGEMLDVPYVTGPSVADRNDVVQLRSSGEMASQTFLALVADVLEDYGLRVVPGDGVYRIVESEALLAEIPQFITSRARIDTPSDLRPVIQFVPVDALPSAEMANLLTQAFGRDNQDLRIEANSQSSFLVLSGLPDQVSAAVAMVEQLDELRYAGTEVLNYVPVYWSADELAESLVQVLSAEGWQAASDPRRQMTILVLPIEFSNSLFIFTRTSQAWVRTRHWLDQLDRPARRGDENQLFVYTVRNLDAQLLTDVVNGALSGMGAAASAPGGAPGGGSAASASAVTADPLGNRLIFSGTASQYERLLPLLRQLDQAPAEVLIEVTIAEISLTDSTASGVEFLIDDIGNSEFDATVGSRGLGLGSGGLDVGILTGNVEMALNAFSENSRVNVLSRPRLLARSGGAASIQVGSDVPVITSRRAAESQAGGGVTDILQSIEYRKTGVLMEIEPIVFGDNRIDLNLTQEVSTALTTTTADISSPTISNRTITTTLSLYDGEMVVLGGLIQDNYTRSERGIPFLKDVPVAGRLFASDNTSVDRTELVLLITAYILRGPEDRARFVDHVTGALRQTLESDGDLDTLTPRDRLWSLREADEAARAPGS